MEKSLKLNSGSWIVPITLVVTLACSLKEAIGQTLPANVGQQAVTDAAAQQERDRQARMTTQLRPEEKPAMEATAVSEDLGSLQLMEEVPSMPFARLRMDQTYNWLSNANYARNSFNVVSAWQTISSLEAAWAPTFTTMRGYESFFPEAGLRASFFNYFTGEEPSQNNNAAGIYDIGLVQDFVLLNLFLRGNRQITDELSVGLSFDYNGFFYLNSASERESALGAGNAGENNFLNEYTFAYTANYFHVFTENQAVALNWRASYVFADPTYFTRTDNNLTGTYIVSLSEKISLTPFASYRLAYYTDAQSAPPTADFNNQGQFTGTDNGFYRRLDQQYTLGLGLNFQLSPELSTALNFNYSKSDSTSRIAETGDFTNLTAGASWSMTYRFSEKEFVVADPSACLGPYVRTDLGFGFVNNLTSSQRLTGSVLPGLTGNLANPVITINPGLRFDVAPGYNFNDWFGLEFSAGILYSGLDNLNGSGSVSTQESAAPVSVPSQGLSLTGRYLQVPALFSAVFRWPGQGRWKPYLSTGFGAAYSQLQITQVGADQTADEMAQQFSPAFSVGSGFLWQVSDMVDFDVMYKLLGLIQPEYSSFQPGTVLSNSVQFGINIRF